jgi:tRNA threonylcarbamoyladenosine biosynthesis protein TsaB
MPKGQKDTYILCIETSTDICSVALCNRDIVVASQTSYEGNSHTEQLTIIISDILSDANIKMNDLSAIAISHGPGSYTSLRVGASTAKGLCYALDIPLIAIGSLDILASPLINKGIEAVIMPMIDARRMEVYTSIYNGSKVIKPSYSLIFDTETVDALKLDYGHLHICGSGAAKCVDLIGIEYCTLYHLTTDAIYMAKLAYNSFEKEVFENVAYYNPEYLKLPNITTTTKKFF